MVKPSLSDWRTSAPGPGAAVDFLPNERGTAQLFDSFWLLRSPLIPLHWWKRREMSPQKWNVWLVITAQGWAVPGESTAVVLLPLPCPLCLFPIPNRPLPFLYHLTIRESQSEGPTHPTFLCLWPCVSTSKSRHNLSWWPHTTLDTAARPAAGLTGREDDKHAESYMYKDKQKAPPPIPPRPTQICWALGLFPSLSSKIHPPIM